MYIEMLLELKKAIIDFIIEHNTTWNRLNFTVDKFRAYIFDSDGNFLIWGREIYDRIHSINDLI